MNLRMSFKLLRDPYFKSAFSASIPPAVVLPLKLELSGFFRSTEGLFHDYLRSPMITEILSLRITKPVIRTHWNQRCCNHDLVKRQYVREFPMDVQDIDFDD